MLWILLRVEYLSWKQGFFALVATEGARGEPRPTILRLEHLLRRFLVFRDKVGMCLVTVDLLRPAIAALSRSRALI